MKRMGLFFIFHHANKETANLGWLAVSLFAVIE